MSKRRETLLLLGSSLAFGLMVLIGGTLIALRAGRLSSALILLVEAPFLLIAAPFEKQIPRFPDEWVENLAMVTIVVGWSVAFYGVAAAVLYFRRRPHPARTDNAPPN